MSPAHIDGRGLGLGSPLCNTNGSPVYLLRIKSREHLRYEVASSAERVDRRNVCKNCLRVFNRKYA
jgi:hypothetical protein